LLHEVFVALESVFATLCHFGHVFGVPVEHQGGSLVEVSLSSVGGLELTTVLEDLTVLVASGSRTGLQEALLHGHAALQRHLAENGLLRRLRLLEHLLLRLALVHHGCLLDLADQILRHDVRLFGSLVRPRSRFGLTYVLVPLCHSLSLHSLGRLECDASFHHGRTVHLWLPLLGRTVFIGCFDFFCDRLVVFFVIFYEEDVFGFLSDFFL
jgi:hypothetical protein